MKLGSLFDGSGGFPLAGAICGIEPVWASEIEPFPIRVTTKRFPNVKHLGSVTDINGAEIEPVDIITFGSPCQDLSVAGKRAGLQDGERSSLFFEAIRIIKEMRENDRAAGRADVDCRPRYIVWENVPGAYSSNGGEDFRCVLEEICKVADPEVSIPRPDKGKWEPAGCILADGHSVAWRTFNAQHWGVPQRRRRIYLVADFAGERAGEILFEQDGLRGNPAESGAQREDSAADAERGTGGSGEPIVFKERAGCPGGGKGILCDVGKTFTLSTMLDQSVCVESGDGTWRVGAACNTLTAGQNIINSACYPDVARTLSARYDSSPCVDRGQETIVIDRAAYCVGNGQMCNITMAPVANTLDCMHDQQIVVADVKWWSGSNVADTITVNSIKQRMPDKSNLNYVVTPARPPRKYIVRRLTPVECARLQGFPDWWCMGLETPEPTEEDIAWAAEVWERWRLITSPNTKPKSRNQLIKWLKAPHSDAAEYKLWGNGIALPCAARVMEGIAKEAHHEPED